MINLRQRSDQEELMDADNIPFNDIARNLKELNIINTRLGGHAITIKGLRYFIKDQATLVVCEIGCGGGDNLFAIHRYCANKNIRVEFIGIDLNPACIAFAKQQYPQLPCQWICSDYSVVHFGDKKPDIIFSSLFCHHFADEQLVPMLQWLQQNCYKGFFINDLHRHWLAYYLIKYITRFFSRSYMTKNDACISVSRGFRKKDWEQLFQKAGLGQYNLKWEWAYRYLITCNK